MTHQTRLHTALHGGHFIPTGDSLPVRPSFPGVPQGVFLVPLVIVCPLASFSKKRPSELTCSIRGLRTPLGDVFLFFFFVPPSSAALVYVPGLPLEHLAAASALWFLGALFVLLSSTSGAPHIPLKCETYRSVSASVCLLFVSCVRPSSRLPRCSMTSSAFLCPYAALRDHSCQSDTRRSRDDIYVWTHASGPSAPLIWFWL